MGGGRETSGNGSYFPAAHLLPLGLTRWYAPFRRERSERAESPTENHENTAGWNKKGLTKHKQLFFMLLYGLLYLNLFLVLVE